jgi:hypothetical protein
MLYGYRSDFSNLKMHIINMMLIWQRFTGLKILEKWHLIFSRKLNNIIQSEFSTNPVQSEI